jgi:4-carboxymuconolactone decarboxylase
VRHDPTTRPERRPQIHIDDLSDDQRELYDNLVNGPRKDPAVEVRHDLTDGHGNILGWADAFLSPAIGNALQEFGAAVRFKGHLSQRIIELSILTITQSRGNEWLRTDHETIARALAGISEAEIAAIREGSVPELTDAKELAALRLVRSLLEGDVDDETWAACFPPLELVDLFELECLVSYYSTLSLIIRVARFEPLS